MKRLSNIEESHWSDMNRRSQGILKRKEDNVNILDLESLHSYIRNTYDYTSPLVIFVLPVIPGVRKEPELFITLTNCKNKDRSLYYRENDSVFMTYDDVNALNCMDLLSRKYNAFYKRGSKYVKSMVYISPKDNSKKIDNKFFLDVLDYILMNIKNPCLTKKKNVNESHWFEMNRRSQGIVQRREDDYVNRYTLNDFVEFLRDTYLPNIRIYRVRNFPADHIIEIPLWLEPDLEFEYVHMSLKYNDSGKITSISFFKSFFNRYIEMIEDMKLFLSFGGDKYIFNRDLSEIFPKFPQSKYIKYSDCIEIIDAFLDNVPYHITKRNAGPLVKKKS